MTESKRQPGDIEQRLKQARLLEPTPQLRDRASTAAKHAWDTAPAEVPWQIPLRRLALSAAAALIIVSAASRLGGLARPRPRPGVNTGTSTPNPDLEELTETVYGASWSRLGTGLRRSSEFGGAARRDKMGTLRSMLNDIENEGTPAQPTPGGGRSRLLPGRPRVGSHS